MNELELTGQARTHVVELSEPRCVLHYEAVASFLAMRDAASNGDPATTPVTTEPTTPTSTGHERKRRRPGTRSRESRSPSRR